MTLIEIVVTVWILGAIVVTMSGSLLTMEGASDIAKRGTNVEVTLRHYAEAVRAETYVACAQTTDYQNPPDQNGNPGNPPGFDPTVANPPVTVQVMSVTYWVQSAPGNLTVNPSTFQTYAQVSASGQSCDPNAVDGDGNPIAPSDDGIQLVTVKAFDTAEPGINATTSFIKRETS